MSAKDHPAGLARLLVYASEGGIGNLTYLGVARDLDELGELLGSLPKPYTWDALEIHARTMDAITGNMIIRGEPGGVAFFQEHGTCRGFMTYLQKVFASVEDVLALKNQK